MLSITNGGTSYRRIKEAIDILQRPIVIRDFTYKGEKIKFMQSVFITAVFQKEGEGEKIYFKIEDMFAEACKQKYAGYTKLNLEDTNVFKSKYALKLFEMYKRYENLPNSEDHGCVVVKKDLDYLNNIFCTNYSHPSRLFSSKEDLKTLPPINKGLKEIKEKFDVDIYCFYYKPEKSFVFVWTRPNKYPNLRIPMSQINEFLIWYIDIRNENISDVQKYYKSLYKSLLDGTFNNLDNNYRNFLKLKYNLTEEVINMYVYDQYTQKYKEYPLRNQLSLF